MVRDYSGFSDFQIKKHLTRLDDLEYVLIHKGKRGQSFEYELLYQGEGDDQNRFLMGLIDIENFQYDAKKDPLKPNKEPCRCPQSAPKLPLSSTAEITKNIEKNSLKQTLHPIAAENAPYAEKAPNFASHHTFTALAAKV